MIYFDHNATTPLDGRVVEVMLPYLQRLHGNPSSLHRLGRIARSAIDCAREQLAELVDAKPAQILFTSGGTEANAIAMASSRGRRLLCSALEHPSVIDNARLHRQADDQTVWLPVNPNGCLTEQPSLLPGDFVSLMLANNETGAIQDLQTITLQAAAVDDVIVHSDAVQALGKIPVSFRKLGLQLMSLSSHKIYGPKGAGALVVADHRLIHPLQRGGDQEYGLRAGTENVAAIVGFGKAAELARLELQQRSVHLGQLRDYLEQRLRAIPRLVIFADTSQRLPNTVQFAVPGTDGAMLLMQLDQQQIAVSSGSACKAGSDQTSPVLQAMAIEADLAKAAIRVSLGKDNQLQQIDQFVNVIETLTHQHGK